MRTTKQLITLAITTAVLFTTCKKDDFFEKIGVCPVVLSTIPANEATNVPLNQVITITFNEEMNAETITTESITIQGTTTFITGTLTYSGATASFTPDDPLTLNMTYTGRVKTSVKDLDGNALQTDYVWTFSTGLSLAPMVVSTDPENNDTLVVLDKTVTATFNMAMNPLTIDGTTFTLTEGTNPVTGVVTYSGMTATFNPTTDLEDFTEYTGTITTGAENVAGDALTNDYVWTFTTGSSDPMVILTDPLNNATGVALNKTITANFNMAMDPSTINATSFTVMDGTTPVLGVVTYSGTTATFNPAGNLSMETTYTATITTAVESTTGVALANNYVWTFETISAAPVITLTDPLNNATGVALNKTITANFNMAMDPSTINTTSFTVMDGTTPVIGVVTYSGTTASFNPTGNLSTGTTYTATITTGAESTTGVPMANNYIWTFETLTAAPLVTLTDPEDMETGVVLNKTITANFNMAMDPSTINATSFTVMDGTTPVIGVVTYSGTTASFNPTSNLSTGTTYTATITTGAESTTGVPLANDYEWTFETLTAAPLVTLTDPEDMETDVALNKTITANFNMAMDPSTINSTNFTVMDGTNSVAGIVTYSGTTATFNPTNNLLSGTTYTATITTGAESTTSMPLANDYEWTFETVAPLGGPFVDLGGVERFGIISGVGVSNQAGVSEIHDLDVGIYPGFRSSITGFYDVDGGPGLIFNGDFYAADDGPAIAAMLLDAKNDLTAAYLFAEGASTPAPSSVSGDQGGTTLAPGIYKTTSTLLIQSGDLTLDAQGDANAVWIFQIASGFTTVGGAGGNVILSGGAQAKNIFWQVGSSATIGDYTSFKGNILALTSITMNAYATIEGRVLCINGAAVLTSTNIITKP